jgi:hypothetical protein
MLLFAACNQRQQIALVYRVAVEPSQIARVETLVSVDPADGRMFFADQPFRSVGTGVGYEVSSGDESGTRVMKITQEAALGFKFGAEFQFTLLPPVEGDAPPLVVRARAVGASRNMLGETQPMPAQFGPGQVVTVEIADQRCGGEACAADESCCGSACTRTASDAKNCGACGSVCGQNESCAGGHCKCAGGSGCSGGRSCCQDGCFDLQSDMQNCGACGNACNAGETCVAGSCRCAGEPGGGGCGAGGLCCPGAGCSNSGTCPCGTELCNGMQICCGTSCKSYLVDNANCGTCGTTCTLPLTCSSGSCRCQGVLCTGGDACCMSGCKNLQVDPQNCGTCGRSCAAGETCVAGNCRCGNTACGADQICCGGVCKNKLTDRDNCGGCNVHCGTGEQCMSGMCRCNGGPPCVGGTTCCPAGATQGGCFDLSSDPLHCGDCTRRCDPGWSCVMGNCKPGGDVCDPPCMNGHDCVGGVCTCMGGPACAPGETCCGNGCHNLLNDPQNCGECKNACRYAELCCEAKCTTQDEQNCGECKMMCGPFQSCCLDSSGKGTCRGGIICSDNP